MDLSKNKQLIKKLRTEFEDSTCELHVEFASELIELCNIMISRINCYATDDDSELERLAIEDGLRE